MADGGGAPAAADTTGGPADVAPAPASIAGPGGHGAHHAAQVNLAPTWQKDGLPMSPPLHTPANFGQHRHASLDLDDYFTGPRDLGRHSKWPIFLQMHGSILPKMLLPLLFSTAWATCITLVSKYTSASVSTNPILLTVTGFVVGLGLSFRSATAYERYAEGRRYWAQLILCCQNLGRVYWIHAKERPGAQAHKDMLTKLTALNLLVAFAVSLKHKLRFEPYTCYDDLDSLVSHLQTFAAAATRDEPERATNKKAGLFKSTGEYLGVSFASSNPRKVIKDSTRPLGNLPLEILSYLAALTDELVENGQLTIPMQQTLAYNNLASLNDVLTGTERVLTTPLPIAYSIAVSQITWVYVVLLPFQLISVLGWTTIPATAAATYIILGILYIGREIENPFGHDVNDLPLESYCAQVAAEMDVLASRPKPRASDWVEHPDNRVLWPLSGSGWHVWHDRGDERVREAVRAKTELGYEARREMSASTVETAKAAEKRATSRDESV